MVKKETKITFFFVEKQISEIGKNFSLKTFNIASSDLFFSKSETTCLSVHSVTSVHEYVCTDLPLSPGTAAIQIILAEQTAIHASTVGSSLMFSRQTCKGNISISLQNPNYVVFCFSFFLFDQTTQNNRIQSLLTCPTYPSLLHTHTSHPLSRQLWLGEAHENWRQTAK